MGHKKAQKTVYAFCGSLWLFFVTVTAQDSRNLTPTQLNIQQQQQRLSSSDPEERRDAVMRLGTMQLEAASRVALPALKDPSPAIRATATKAILAIGGDESASVLIPLLTDKDEFVRRETAYALGLTKSRTATAPLSERLLNDKEDGVRGAAAVALGHIADEAGVVALAGVLAPELSAPAKSKRKREQNVFVLRAAATSLGQIGSRAGTAALISALSNQNFPGDVRREAARSLGLIGDPSAEPALRVATTSSDPYLSEIAHKAIRRLHR
jgi:HEAT repeat protein